MILEITYRGNLVGFQVLNMKYYCDKYRHLVCKPYSIENLHKMAKDLGIKRCWFHKTHYDIPKTRISKIEVKCNIVSSKEIVNIIKKALFQ